MFGPPKCPVYVKLPWTGPASNVFTEKIPLSVMRVFYSVKVRGIFRTRSANLSFRKDVLPIQQQSRVVYKFQCLCNADYIGWAFQILKVRVELHVPRGIRSRSQLLISGVKQSHESVFHKHLCDYFFYAGRVIQMSVSLLFTRLGVRNTQCYYRL